MSEAAPPLIERSALPPRVTDALLDDETVFYAETPIRRAGGIGVWLIMGLGVAFVPASVGALREIALRLDTLPSLLSRVVAIALAGGLGLVFLVFSLAMLVWPLLSEWSRRRTIVVVTDGRVLKLTGHARGARPLKVRAWDVSACEHASVARRRGASATLVLKERVRVRKTDGQPVYEWDALHGLPDADRALAALLHARARKLGEVQAAVVDARG